MDLSPLRILSAARGFARFLFHLGVFASFIFCIFLIAVWVEKSAIKQSKPTEKLPPLFIEEIPISNSTGTPPPNFSDLSSERIEPPHFPFPARLTNRNGVTIETVLLSRPAEDRITFRKKQDNRVYTINTVYLHEISKNLVDAFVVDFNPGSQFLPAPEFRPLAQTGSRTFPVPCTISSFDGRSIQVTLLDRPTLHSITFRRQADQQVFTIPIDRLSLRDSSIVRQFEVNP